MHNTKIIYNLQSHSLKGEGGFTFVEVIVALTIFIILFSLAAPVTLNFYRSRSLISERDSVVGLLRRARGLAMANRNQSDHGLFMGNNSTIIFQGVSYALRNQEFDEIFSRENSITASGATEIIFRALDGAATSVNGTTTISLGLSDNIRTISFNAEGGILW
ncbi:MAG: prepilin-type N-terminal cleavage/methylation domain-containing protein [Candidatus Liptonbacteria bacterium]|nr:prepilin-type N-terminal cleavage/methylation domain-containing protein [Candidatus Liptonbacteria bacterium]